MEYGSRNTQDANMINTFNQSWPEIQRRLIEKGFPLSRRNINTYRAQAFEEFRKNWNAKIAPVLEQRAREYEFAKRAGAYYRQEYEFEKARTRAYYRQAF